MEIVFWILVGFFWGLVVRGMFNKHSDDLTKEEVIELANRQFEKDYEAYKASRRAK